jgi:putative transposase
MKAGQDQGHRPELVGGGLIRSMGGWSQVLTLRRQGQIESSEWIKKKCQETDTYEAELRSGNRRRAVSELRKEICFYLYRELGIPMAEIAREVGIGTTGVAMIIKRSEKIQK